MKRFPNLNAEMARNEISGTAISKKMGISPKSFSNKMIGKSEFTRSEMMKIQKVFDGLSVEYLFQLTDKQNPG